MNRFALPIVLAGLLGCASDKQDPNLPMARVATAPAGDLTVDLLTDGQLATGMTPIYLEVRTAAGQLVTDAAVTFAPLMTMTSGTHHGAPVVGVPTVGADGRYRCDAVFQMASSGMGSWSATVTITRPGLAPVEASFPSLPVADSGCARTFSATDPVTSVVTKYVASLNLQGAARVGLNPVVVTLHRMQDMMVFVSVDDATLALDPQMPSMGHGAPGSVNPTLESPGIYQGQLSFSMPGDWETTVTVSRGGLTLGAPRFATTF